ncbi:MAG: DUF1667 domain-containing protein [Thermoguttaceae bacterium]|nr:DUF1667 domain-containing protein [Thermoguttaceae bacterium]MBP3693242.1 DUF1667 domain-containing protein [Thermoguttaceae bacterium]MBQ4144757.1 DUF1667 domain-containing protein [Thermoguttaceae bacterium]
MSEKKELICIVCPRGCHLTVDENMNVTGNFCKRGEVYGKNEVTNPTRTITSTVKIAGGTIPRLPVKTSQPIPKGRIFDVMAEIDRLTVQAPVEMNAVLLPNVLGTGADILATREIAAANS